MLTFLFWNLNKKPLEQQVVNLADRYAIDIILLAESTLNSGNMLLQLNAKKADYHYSPKVGCSKFEIFVKFPTSHIRPIHETSRISIQEVKRSGGRDFLMAVVHLQSKRNASPDSQVQYAVHHAQQISQAEKTAGHRRTIVIGDLNMNPFESGIAGALGFHATMSRDIASRISRSIDGQDYFYFYNPMWSLMGDLNNKPPGTHFYEKSEPVQLGWNMYDQVLLRPDLISSFDKGSIEILTHDGANSLLNNNGIPRGIHLSDHLPIVLRMDL